MAARINLVGATPGDLIALLSQRHELTLPPSRYRALLSQIALGEAFAVYDNPAGIPVPVAIAGIAPLGRGAGEIWFGVRSGGLGSLLLPVVKAARDVIEARRSAYPLGLMCLVEDGHLPGERLARLIGCVPTGVFLGRHREWACLSSARHSAVGSSSSNS